MHDRGLRIPQEIAFTTGGLTRVGVFALIAFGTMALLLDPEFRIAAYLTGVAAIGAVTLLLIYLHWQRRYGEATLIAEGLYEPGRAFAGTIVTGLREVPGSRIRVKIAGWSTRSESTLSRTTVDPVDVRRDDAGTLVIPFRVPPPEEGNDWRPREVRLRVRTAHWPVGWGATFVIGETP